MCWYRPEWKKEEGGRKKKKKGSVLTLVAVTVFVTWHITEGILPHMAANLVG